MAKFAYNLCFSPYHCTIRAKNYKDAWRKLKELYPEYNVKEVITYLSRQY